MDTKLILLPFCTFLLILSCYLPPVCAADKNANENREDTGEANDETNDTNESLGIDENEYINNTISCTRRQNSLIHEMRTARELQFPFMAAIMSQQDEYLCAGAVVSNGLILTSATCTLKPTKYVLLNATKAMKSATTIAVNILKSEKFPTYSGPDSDKDVGIIFTEKYKSSAANKIKLSNLTASRLVQDMEPIGYGLNSELGQTKELQYIGVENRKLVTYGQRDILKGYFDCVATKVPTCFRDIGGPVVYDNELIGIVVQGQPDCIKEITIQYALNKNIVEVLPIFVFKAWLEERITKNEESGPVALAIHPKQPSRRSNDDKALTEKAGAPPIRQLSSTTTTTALSFGLSCVVMLISLFI